MLLLFFLRSLFTNLLEFNSRLDKSCFAMMTRELAARDGNPLSPIGDAVEARTPHLGQVRRQKSDDDDDARNDSDVVDSRAKVRRGKQAERRA